ncbi:MAG TPA: RNA polymerase sigma factor [Thermoanaerobaculia bacterium]
MSAPFQAADAARNSPGKRMDEAAFEALYRRTAGALWAYIHRLTGDAAASDDLLQKTFFRFLRANPTFADDDHARRWIYRTATNLTFDHFRETKRSRERESAYAPNASRAESGDLRHDMMRTFGELKPRERALLWLAHVEESDHEEISEALGVKSGSVRVLLFRARKRLAELLTKRGLQP